MILLLSVIFFLASIKFDKLHNLSHSQLVVIYLIFLLVYKMCIKNKETFSILEQKIIGISGPSTIDTLQKMQDKEIQNLESLYKTLHSVYKKKGDKLQADKYKKIPIVSSCKTVGKTDTFNTDFGFNQNLNPIPNVNNEMTGMDFIELQNKLNSNN